MAPLEIRSTDLSLVVVDRYVVDRYRVGRGPVDWIHPRGEGRWFFSSSNQPDQEDGPKHRGSKTILRDSRTEDHRVTHSKDINRTYTVIGLIDSTLRRGSRRQSIVEPCNFNTIWGINLSHRPKTTGDVDCQLFTQGQPIQLCHTAINSVVQVRIGLRLPPPPPPTPKP